MLVEPDPQVQDPEAQSDLSARVQQLWEAQRPADSAETHFALAEAHARYGDTDRAIEEYTLALTYDASSPLIFAKLAEEYAKKNQFTLAMDYAEKARALDPKQREVWSLIGNIALQLNQWKEAETAFLRALQMEPDHEESAALLIQIYSETSAFKKADQIGSAFLKRTPESPLILYLLGRISETQNRFDSAVKHYSKALILRPGFSAAALSLAGVYDALGKSVAAKTVLERSFEANPDAKIGTFLANDYLKHQQMDQALSTLKTVALLDPEDLSVGLKIGLIHVHQQRWDEAEKVLKGLATKVPESDKIHFYLGSVYREQKRYQEALIAFENVKKESQLFEDARLFQTQIYRVQGKEDVAQSTLERAIASMPESPLLRLTLASFLESQENFEKANDVLVRGLKDFPDHDLLNFSHAAMLEKLGRPDDAIDAMLKLIQKNPNHAEALNFVGYAWTVREMNLDEAHQFLLKAHSLQPQSPHIMDSLGLNHIKRGQVSLAIPFLEKAARLMPDEPTIAEHLALAYQQNILVRKAADVRARSSRKPASVMADKSP